MLDGYAEREKVSMRKTAWAVSHLLIAAGCDAEKVTVEKLLGEKARRRRPQIDPEVQKRRAAERIWQRVECDRKKGE